LYVTEAATFVSFSGVSQAVDAAEKQENYNEEDDDDDYKDPPHVS